MSVAAARERDPTMWTGKEIAAATGATGGAAVMAETLDAVCVDSRRAAPGVLFVALKGVRHDGHDFAAEAVGAGAAAVLVERLPDGVGAERALVVADTLRALGDLAAHTRRRWGGPAVAITGSNGKTTTKEIVAAVCAEAFGSARVLKTNANENNLIGLPLTLLRLVGDEAAAVLELGMNVPGEIARLTAIAVPTVGLITNVGPAHLEGLGSIAGVAAAKGELFAGLEPDAAIAVNRDDPWVVRLAAGWTGRRVEFGSGGEVWAGAVDDRGFDGIAFTLYVGQRSAPVRLRMPGWHNVQNALGAAAAAHALGIDLAAIASGLAAACPPRMRLEVTRLANGVTLVNDAYNANPASTEAALDTLARTPGRAIAVLGEMRELGAHSAALHRRVGAHAAQCGVGWLVAVGGHAEDLAAGARDAGREVDVNICGDAAEAAALLVRGWRAGDVILIKGSRGPDDDAAVRRYGARMAEVATRLAEAGGGS